MARIFISYSRADREFVDEFVPALQHVYGTDTLWYDKHIPGGKSWWQLILSEIAHCDLFIYLVSNDSLASSYCQAEVREALRLRKTILPIIVRPRTVYPDGAEDEELQSLLKATQFVDMTCGLKHAMPFAQLYASLNNLLQQTPDHPPLPTHSRPTPEPVLDVPRRRLKRKHKWALAAGGLLVIILTAAYYFYWRDRDEQHDRLQAALKQAWNFSGENQNWEPFAHDFDGVAMVLVPVGCFEMGSTDEQLSYAQELAVSADWAADEVPDHTVCFTEPFWIDQFEVTNSQFGQEGEFSGAHHPRETVSWAEAEVFCESRNARLPTEAEWEYAARGPSAWIYPWGNVFDESRIVFAGSADGQTADVGSRPSGASWVGALDMIGNVWEWVSDWYDAGYYAQVDDQAANPTGPTTGQERALRGGSWVDDFPTALRAADRYWSEPDTLFNNIGFRCVRPLS